MKVTSPYFVAPYSPAAAEENLLIKAVKSQDFQELKRLLECEGVNINAKDESGSTAFMLAARLNRIDMMELLLPGDFLAFNERNHAGETAMMLAARNNSPHAMLWLAQAGADVNIMDNFGSTAFLEYIRLLPPEVAPSRTVLMEFLRADLNLDSLDVNGRNALMLLAKTPGMAKNILLDSMSDRIDIDAVDENGCTALYIATEFGDIGFVDALVKKGAKVSLMANDTRRPQEVAEDAGNYALFSYLINVFNFQKSSETRLVRAQAAERIPAWIEHYESNALPEADDINEDPDAVVRFGGVDAEVIFARPRHENDYSEFGLPPLLAAAKSSDRGEVGIVLESEGVDVDFQDAYGWNALMYAAVSRQEGFLEFFIDGMIKNEVSFDLNLVNGNRETALVLAAKAGLADNMKVLLKLWDSLDLDVNLPDASGCNALMVYIKGCRDKVDAEVDAEVVQLMLDVDVDLTFRDHSNQTAAIFLAGANGLAAKQIFLQASDVAETLDVIDLYHSTALLRAVNSKDFEYFKLLVEAGATVGLEVNDLSAPKLAKRNGLNEYLKFIDDYQDRVENLSDGDEEYRRMGD